MESSWCAEFPFCDRYFGDFLPEETSLDTTLSIFSKRTVASAGIDFVGWFSGCTIRSLLHEKINPKDVGFQVVSLGDVGFLLFFRVVSFDYGKPWFLVELNQLEG